VIGTYRRGEGRDGGREEAEPDRLVTSGEDVEGNEAQ